jgi:hypothetical protein
VKTTEPKRTGIECLSADDASNDSFAKKMSPKVININISFMIIETILKCQYDPGRRFSRDIFLQNSIERSWPEYL